MGVCADPNTVAVSVQAQKRKRKGANFSKLGPDLIGQLLHIFTFGEYLKKMSVQKSTVASIQTLGGHTVHFARSFHSFTLRKGKRLWRTNGSAQQQALVAVQLLLPSHQICPMSRSNGISELFLHMLNQLSIGKLRSITVLPRTNEQASDHYDLGT